MRLDRSWMQEDWYRVLGVAAHAPESAIRLAYRRAMRRAHPDLRDGDARFALRLNLAVRVLLDRELRRRYDQLRAARRFEAVPSGRRPARTDALTAQLERAAAEPPGPAELAAACEFRPWSVRFVAGLRAQVASLSPALSLALLLAAAYFTGSVLGTVAEQRPAPIALNAVR